MMFASVLRAKETLPAQLIAQVVKHGTQRFLAENCFGVDVV